MNVSMNDGEDEEEGGKKRRAGCKRESITFSTEPNRGQLFFFLQHV